MFKVTVSVAMSMPVILELEVDSAPPEEWAGTVACWYMVKSELQARLSSVLDDEDAMLRLIDEITIQNCKEYCAECDSKGYLILRSSGSKVYGDTLHVERCDACCKYESDAAAEHAALTDIIEGREEIPESLTLFGTEEGARRKTWRRKYTQKQQ